MKGKNCHPPSSRTKLQSKPQNCFAITGPVLRAVNEFSLALQSTSLLITPEEHWSWAPSQFQDELFNCKTFFLEKTMSVSYAASCYPRMDDTFSISWNFVHVANFYRTELSNSALALNRQDVVTPMHTKLLWSQFFFASTTYYKSCSIYKCTALMQVHLQRL